MFSPYEVPYQTTSALPDAINLGLYFFTVTAFALHTTVGVLQTNTQLQLD
ncbi:hypothetical protein S2091_3649 [Solimicrobium silvestre]|uniref:Uncharacterized protein n=1 Tax=Solimicrobium silvestre TaxID=2099400 RepID=A0A2S9GVH9_9BURK|nr:hypothetical protein S2091_3649 [Solimicrobium silvestre]